MQLPFLLLLWVWYAEALYYISLEGNDASACDIANKCQTLGKVFGKINSGPDTTIPQSIFMDPGNYIIGAEVSVNYPVSIQGPGAALICQTTSFCVGIAGTAGGTSISGLTFNGGNPSIKIVTPNAHIFNTSFFSTNSAINVYQSNNFTLENSLVDSNVNSAVFQSMVSIGLSSPVNILNSTFRNIVAPTSSDPTFGTILALRTTGDTTILDCTFYNNSGQYSAVLAYQIAGFFTVERSVFRNNSATGGSGGALQILSDETIATYLISDSEFYNNSATGSGTQAGALYLPGTQSVSYVSNCTFSNNYAEQGGAIYATSTSFYVNSSQFHMNVAAQYGGAMYSALSTTTILDCMFEQNRVASGSSQGGALYLNGSPTTIKGSAFQNNSAPVDGGAILHANAAVYAQNNTFFGNIAAASGGAISFVSTGARFVISCNFTWNTGQDGGAIYTEGPLGIETSYFTYNHATDSGGGLNGAVPNANITTKNCLFYNCTATRYGGAVFLTKGGYQDTGSMAIQNYAQVNGGAFYFVVAGPAILQSTVIAQNQAEQQGGAIVASGVLISLTSCTIYGNIGSTGGALYADQPSSTTTIVNLDECTLSENSATSLGGAIFGSTVIVLVSNSNFLGNRALQAGGGALYLTVSKLQLTTSNFTGNYALASHGGAIYLSDNADPPTISTILHAKFTNNYVTGEWDGGAVETNVNVQFFDCFFFNNSASSGGAISITTATVSVNQSQFLQNIATIQYGGAIVSNAGTLLNQGSIFDKNNAVDKGGAIMMYNSILSLSGSNFTSNVATFGGAIYLRNINISISASLFSQNWAQEGGGVMLFQEQVENPLTVFFDSSTFSSNAATIGGGMALENTQQCLMNNINLQFNVAVDGGGIYSLNSQTTMTGFQFIKNFADGRGGGLYSSNSGFVFSNAFFSGNSATQFGGGMCLDSSSNVQMSDATIVENMAQKGGGAAVANLTVGTFSNCNISNNQAMFGSGFFLESDAVIINSVIDSNTNTSIYINSLEAEQRLVMKTSTLSYSGPYEFCCDGVPQKNVTRGTCNYPSCNARCGGTNGTCTCNATSTPSCTSCAPPYIGAFCNYIDSCQQPGFCNLTVSYCNHDTQYNPVCCPTLQNCMAVNTSTPTTPPTSSTTGTIGLCGGATCSSHATCVSNTCQCSFGYSGNGVVCTLINECNPNNGGCDYHTNCTSMVGYPVCSNCPSGFVFANGNSTCIPLCGDKNCSAALGENCVTCPEDCQISPCNQCGDKHCDRDSETCSTCSEDCGVCITPTCSDPTCSGHGRCQDGLCVCNNQWSGPTCHKNSAPLQVNISQPGSGNDPGLSVTPEDGNAGVSFTLAINAINEVDESQNFVQGVNLASQNFTFSPVAPSSLPAPSGPCTNCSLLSYLSSSSSSSSSSANKQYLLSTPLNNTAYLEILIFEFNDQETSITFARNTSTYSFNTIKLAIQIRLWPFRSLRNSLSIVFSSPQASLSTSSCSQVDSNKDENNNLKWFAININGATLYGQFLDTSVVDGNLRDVNFTLNADYSVSATLPHFWSNAVVDPSFSVLLEDKPKNCASDTSQGGKNIKKIVAIVVPVVVVAVVLVAGAIYIYPKLHAKRQVYHTNKRFQRGKQLETESRENLAQKPVEIEKMDSMSVNSAAGNFSVKW